MPKVEEELRLGILAAILVASLVAARVHGDTSEASSETKTCSLPWRIIAEKAAEGAHFCESTCRPDDEAKTKRNDPKSGPDVNPNYACLPGEAVIARLAVGPAGGSPLRKINMDVAKWADGLWKEAGRSGAIVDSDLIEVADSIGEEGFFRLKSTGAASGRGQLNPEVYAVVCDNWRNDILCFCLRSREEIELNHNLDLSRSIAISHFDYALSKMADARFLSGTVLETLKDAVRAKKVFDQGGCPEIIIGSWTQIRLRRFEGAEIADFAVLIPPNYGNTRKWPVQINVGGAGNAGNSDHSEPPTYVIVNWGFPGFSSEFEWKDLEYLMSFLSDRLNLDKERISICGRCGHGIAAMAIALHRPDYFAGCSTSTGNSYRHLAGNALNLPVFFEYHPGAHLSPYCNFAAKCFQYYGCSHVQLIRTEPAEPQLVSPTERARQRPERVLYTTDSLDHSRAYWVEINGRTDENFAATIDVSVKGQTVRVKTKNVDAYSLDLLQAPLDSNRPIEIVENAKSLGFAKREAFARKPEAYTSVAYVKDEHLHGPVCDAFRDPYVVVWGAGDGDERLSELSKELAQSLANGAPCFADTNMPAGLVDSHNLILVGTAESNRWLAKICKDLPVRVEQAHIAANGKRYDASDMGFILIHPNPMNPGKYVVVFSATSSAAMAKAHQAYAQMKVRRPSDEIQAADVGIFELSEGGGIKWHVMEKFSTTWGWHEHWDHVLAAVNNKHPKWQWRQWFAAALREQLGADVVICMDPLKYTDLVPEGQITHRDLFNIFRNDWIIKVEVDGKLLKELLLAPFSDGSAPRTTMPIIDGVTIMPSKHDDDGKAMGIEELKEGSVFVAAIPYRFVNGEQLGVGLTEYEIVGEGYSVLLLKDYLHNAEDLDLDAQLDGMKLNIF